MRRLLVRVPRLLVAAHRVAPAADVHVDVRRHVVDVAHRDLAAEVVRTRFRQTRILRRLHEVDVEVAGAGVADVPREDGLEDGANLLHVLRFEIHISAPGAQQHPGLGLQREHVQVVRVARRDLVHLPRVQRVEHPAAGALGVGLEPHVEGVDERLFDLGRTRPVLLRLLHGGVGRAFVAGRHAAVQVRRQRPRLAPVARSALRVLHLRGAERLLRDRGAEGVHEQEALVEVGLGLLGRRGDRAVVRTEVAVERRRVPVAVARLRRAPQGGARHLRRVALPARTPGHQHRQAHRQHQITSPHRASSSCSPPVAGVRPRGPPYRPPADSRPRIP